MSTARFVAYYRVSTGKQSRSALGLEAQRAAVETHVAGAHGAVAARFIEIESGRKKDRPQLAAASAAARAQRAVLVIAKLDRLARSVHFVSGLMESGVEFVAADMPTVNRLTVHIVAAVAEEEARMISAHQGRTRRRQGTRRPARQSQPGRRLARGGACRQRREDQAGAGAGGRRAALHRAGPVRRRHHPAAARRRARRARCPDPPGAAGAGIPCR